jgi:hypothetical protein
MLRCHNPFVDIKKQRAVPYALDLRGKRVAFFNNNKLNGNILFDFLAEEYGKRIEVNSSTRLKKASPAHKAPAKLLKQMSEEMEIVINGVGD